MYEFSSAIRGLNSSIKIGQLVAVTVSRLFGSELKLKTRLVPCPRREEPQLSTVVLMGPVPTSCGSAPIKNRLEEGSNICANG